jgi:hypothetical protein
VLELRNVSKAKRFMDALCSIEGAAGKSEREREREREREGERNKRQ